MSKYIDQVRFGVEMEICVHILDSDSFTLPTPTYEELKLQHNDDVKRWQKEIKEISTSTVFMLPPPRPADIPEWEEYKTADIIKEYRQHLQELDNSITWDILLSDDNKERAVTYKNWLLMPDISVRCNYYDKDHPHSPKHCIIEGKKTNPEFCQQYIFFPVEIVSPVYVGRKGLDHFAYVYNDILLSDRLVYSVNKSQGMHINISHPDMNVERFLELWKHVEPVVWQLIGRERRKRASMYAKPFMIEARKKGQQFSDYIKDKFVSLGYKQGVNERFELRLVGQEFRIMHTLMWISLCMWLLAISIDNDLDLVYTDDKQLMLKQFFNLLNKPLANYFIRLYDQNKSKNWPKYDRKI